MNAVKANGDLFMEAWRDYPEDSKFSGAIDNFKWGLGYLLEPFRRPEGDAELIKRLEGWKRQFEDAGQWTLE